MNKVVDEMVAEPKTKTVASQLKTIMQTMVDDEKKLIEYQREAYVKCVSEHNAPEEVESWNKEHMDIFLSEFEKQIPNGSIENVSEVFDTEEITKGGDDMGDEWKSNPATENQLKWCKDIVAKATDKNIDGLSELKELWNGGDINGQTASDIISNWNDKVK